MNDKLKELRGKVAVRLADHDEKRPRFDEDTQWYFTVIQNRIITGILNYAVECDRDMLAILDALIEEGER